jgi:hypothetical protein
MQKFILYFSDVHTILYELLKFNEFLETFKSENYFEID